MRRCAASHVRLALAAVLALAGAAAVAGGGAAGGGAGSAGVAVAGGAAAAAGVGAVTAGAIAAGVPVATAPVNVLAKSAGSMQDASAMPVFEQVRAAYLPSDAQLLDRHGQPVQSLRVNMQVRRLPWVALDDISPSLPAAALQAEDQRFYEHDGVDLKAIGKAAWDNLWRKRTRGASTITMQVAAQLDPAMRGGTAGRSWRQKWGQAMAARQLEAGWTKHQILEAYLNLVSFRGELQGVGAAARGLFGKAPSGLNQSEAVILASLLRAPEAPVRQVASRACALAREMRMPDTCTAIEQSTALALSRPLLASTLPPAPQVARQLLKEGAGPVRSTLDGDLQRYVQGALRQQLMALRTRNVNDGAVVVLDNASGDILAYVGNAGGSDVDGVTALRQAGSTLKPFLYELALERRLITAASLLEDSPIDISTPSGLYIPQNYDKDFKGYVSARTGLASSLNVPAVRTLLMTGLDRFHDRLQALGLDSLTEPAEYYGYSLALGSAEVSLLELSNAYRTLASGGLQGAAGLLPRPQQTRRRVLDAGAAFIVSDMLADRAARSLTFGLKNELATTVWSAVKTGTSKDMRDNWCLGYTERYTVGVWVGNFDGQSMWDVSGVSGAAPVWRDVIDYLHRHEPSRAPAVPEGVVRRQVAFQPALEAPRAEWFLAGTETPVVALVDDARRVPRILYPGQSSIIAIDPDIPESSQRVTFQAQAGQGLRWQLDGALLGQAGADYAWRPTAGPHQLALVDADARVIAETRFHVR